VIFRQASLGVSAAVKAAETPAEKLAIAQAQADWSIPALWVFLGAYLVFAGMTWFFYLRKSFATDKVPSFARPRSRSRPTRRLQDGGRRETDGRRGRAPQ